MCDEDTLFTNTTKDKSRKLTEILIRTVSGSRTVFVNGRREIDLKKQIPKQLHKATAESTLLFL